MKACADSQCRVLFGTVVNGPHTRTALTYRVVPHAGTARGRGNACLVRSISLNPVGELELKVKREFTTSSRCTVRRFSEFRFRTCLGRCVVLSRRARRASSSIAAAPGLVRRSPTSFKGSQQAAHYISHVKG